MDTHDKKNLALSIRLPLWAKLVITVIIMAALIFIVYRFNIPNPNMILIAGLVITSSLFGYPGGITASIIMFGYTLFFFSKGNDFVTFDQVNTQKVIVSLIGIIVDMIFVCALKYSTDKAFKVIHGLTDQLHADNTRLAEASQIDGLTRICNRLALRNNYRSYTGKLLYVMMIDIDNFKLINDKYGHIVGDQVLEDTGKLLTELFGKENSYRYGGDEFLVIAANLNDTEFNEKLDKLHTYRPHIDVEGKNIIINYSVGYVHQVADHEHELRDMISDADELMYEDKRDEMHKTTNVHA